MQWGLMVDGCIGSMAMHEGCFAAWTIVCWWLCRNRAVLTAFIFCLNARLCLSALAEGSRFAQAPTASHARRNIQQHMCVRRSWMGPASHAGGLLTQTLHVTHCSSSPIHPNPQLPFP